jgi:hypothetical protein
MTVTPEVTLKEQVAKNTIVAVVGSGVSVAVTGNVPTASWSGLLRSGIDRAVSFNRGLPDDWKDHVLKELAYAEEHKYLPDLLSAADKLTLALGGKNGGEFKSWIRADIGELKPNGEHDGKELLHAIGSLGVPIVTTNYDTLIEKELTRPSCTWKDTSEAQLSIRGEISNIFHLHGIWSQPESIVLGSMSYAELLASPSAQAIERILSGGSSLLFIGCGLGLSDPNFESLRTWLKDILPSSEARHYRLCLDQETEQLASLHKEDRIIPVSYGASYSSLVNFLQSLAARSDLHTELTRFNPKVVPQQAVEAIWARVRTETIMAEHLADVETRALDDILIPPVLLPVTPEQFAQAANLDLETRPKRCDPFQDARDYKALLIAADETAGLTSSLEWLVTQANVNDGSLTPVIVDFRQLGTGHRPLERQVRKELRLAGIDLHPSEPLPRLALALDNISIRPDKIFSRAIDELLSESYGFIAIGCRQGAEADILERLRGLSINPVIRYVGRLNNSDATKIATLVEPTRASRLASKAIHIAKSEHLPRTPLTIGLLVCMLLHGETLLTAASPTALLDAWVNLLLGRGDPHDDARFSLDSLERANILASLAEQFVYARAGSLSETATIKCLEEYFAAVGWSEDPIDVLRSFQKRYLLTVRNGQVKFAQSSYLHLFAAKKAIESKDFRDALYEDPLYFSPILRHYAALTRNDAGLLRRVERLLMPTEPIGSPAKDGIFSDVEDADDLQVNSIDDLVHRLSLSGDHRDEEDEEPDEVELDESTDPMDDWLDQDHDTDREPFPLENIEDAAPTVRIVAALALVSNVLRDSELVKDLPLKERILHRTLQIWGKFVDLLHANDGFRDLSRELADGLAEAWGMSDRRRAKFADEFCEMASMLIGLQAISGTLSSRKLLRSLDACFNNEEFVTDAGGSVMGALLALDIGEPGWAKFFTEVQLRHGRVKAVWITLLNIAQTAYYSDGLDERDSDRLLQFLVNQYMLRVSYRSALERKGYADRIARQLKQNRILNRSRMQPLEDRTTQSTVEFP